MATFYLGVFLVGITLIALITVLGEVLEPVLDVLWSAFMLKEIALLSPIPIFAALTSFGITGFLLTSATFLPTIIILFISISLGVLTILALYFLIIKPRELSETSLSFSIKQTVGLQGIVSIPIPADGFGEVMIKIGGGNSNQIAASFDKVEISQDEKVFVVDEKDGVLYVSILTI